MKKANRWSHGRANFHLPALPNDLKGRHGCRLQRVTFDASVGDEVCAMYMEEPNFVDQYSEVSPFNLIVHPGLITTPHGILAFVIWQIAAGSPQEVMVEHYLNPQNFETIRLVASAANQTHFKLLVVNNQNAEVAAFVDFQNSFRFDQFVSAMTLAIGHEPENNFDAAMQYVMDNVTLAELLAMSGFQ